MGVRIWVNRILGALTADNKTLYKINPVIVTGQTLYELELANPVLQEPTLHSAGNMNNLFNFDNLLAMGNAEYSTTDWFGSVVTETIKDKVTGNLIAVLITNKISNIQHTITERLYAEDGVRIVQEREMTWNKINGEWRTSID